MCLNRWLAQNWQTVHFGVRVFLIYNVKNRNVQVAADDGHISKLLAETSSSRARSKCNRALAGWEKAQNLRTGNPSRQGEGREQGGRQSVLACLSQQKRSQVWRTEALSPSLVLYRAPLIESEGSPSTSVWARSRETASLLLQRCLGKGHYGVRAFVGNSLSICGRQQIRLTCFDKKRTSCSSCDWYACALELSRALTMTSPGW